MEERWVGTPALRAQVRESLTRELMLRLMLHDLRGSVTAVMGWVELLGMDGHQVSGGLSRSVEGFQQVISRYSDVQWPGLPHPEQPGILGLVSRGLGVPTHGNEGPGPVESLRLVSVLEQVGPSLVELLVESMDGVMLQTIRVHGLSDEAVSLALAPHHDRVLSLLGSADPLLGVCLLREVARSGRGEVRSRLGGTIDLVCRV